MEVFYLNNIYDLPILDPNCCTIGAFDGLHLGHLDLINITKESRLNSLVITFLSLKKENNYLTTIDQKIKYLEEIGVDYLIVFDFRAVEKVFFNEFIKILKKLKVKQVVCGNDFRFGFKREGDVVDLKKHFKVIEKDYTMYNQIRVSTSIIKELLINGDVKNANKLLNKPYTIVGEVIKGNQIGRKLGYPTANIDYKGYLLPENGVYIVSVLYDKKTFIGMANIGYNPTLNQQENRRLEVHILDFNEEIYGKNIEVSFIEFLRKEKKFNSKEELISSLDETLNICRNYNNMLK